MWLLKRMECIEGAAEMNGQIKKFLRRVEPNMLFSEVHPYVRYARLVKVDENTCFRDYVKICASL